jgi:hypothetical protein
MSRKSASWPVSSNPPHLPDSASRPSQVTRGRLQSSPAIAVSSRSAPMGRSAFTSIRGWKLTVSWFQKLGAMTIIYPVRSNFRALLGPSCHDLSMMMDRSDVIFRRAWTGDVSDVLPGALWAYIPSLFFSARINRSSKKSNSLSSRWPSR